MLRGIVHFSLRFRGVVLCLAAVLLVYGAYSARNAKLDVLPDFVPPQVVVQAEAPGLSPEQVETLVTRPLENALNGVPGLDQLRSESIQGLAAVTVVFKEGTDIMAARQIVGEKLAQAELPAGVGPAKMEPLTSSTMDLLKIGLLSRKVSPMDLRTFADWTLKPRLLSVPGVAKVSVFGGEVRQMQIQVRPAALAARGLSLADVLAAARASTGVLGAGFIDTRNQRVLLQSDGQSLTAEAVGNVLLSGTGGAGAVRLRDVATVTEAAAPAAGDALIMGRPGVLLTLSSQYGANTLDATHALEAAIAEMKPMIARQGIDLYPALHRPATFIDASLRNIRHSLVLGAILVAVVLVLFLGRLRTAFISLISIPLSLLAAILILDRSGLSLNTLTLGGLAIAIGEVVDDAIIDVENIVRRLRENRESSSPRPATEVIFEASLEVRSAVVYATFIVALVFLPVVTLTGLQGAFFSPLAKAYILAIMMSLLVALTVTPALCVFLLSGGVRAGPPPKLQVFLHRRYERLLRGVERYPAWVGAGVGVLLLFAAAQLFHLGGEFLPDFREGHFVLQVTLAPGSSLAESRRVGAQISQAVLKDPRVATIHDQIGRAELGEDISGPNEDEFHVELKPGLSGRDMAEIEQEFRRLLAGTPGIVADVRTFVTDRIDESISGETAPVVVNIFGDDLDALDAKAAEVARVLASVPGAAGVAEKAPPGAPAIAIRLRPESLTALGLRPRDVLETVQAAYSGTVAAQIYRGDRTEDLSVILDPASRRDPGGVGSLLLATAAGGTVPLRAVADIYLTSARSDIRHEGARRRQTVTCATTRPVGEFVADAQAAVARQVSLPEGMYIEFAGAAQTEKAGTRELLLHAAVAMVGILLLLHIVLGNWPNLILVLANLPFALVGGVLALALAQALGNGGSISMGSLVGFVTLFGITTRNSIMLISHYEHLVTREGMTWNLETAIRGASERLVPILMTATVTAIGLLPLALGSGEAGQEIEGPMAQVILGGLVTSIVLNLVVLPTLALRFGRFGDDRN